MIQFTFISQRFIKTRVSITKFSQTLSRHDEKSSSLETLISLQNSTFVIAERGQDFGDESGKENC